MKSTSEVLICDRCGLKFFYYEGYEEFEDEGVVCSHCIDEEHIMSENEKG